MIDLSLKKNENKLTLKNKSNFFNEADLIQIIFQKKIKGNIALNEFFRNVSDDLINK